jgi:hypothetical protein
MKRKLSGGQYFHQYKCINKTNNHLSHFQIIELIIDNTYEVGNPVAGLGQAQTCGGVKQINGIPNPSYLIIAYPTAIHVYCSLS